MKSLLKIFISTVIISLICIGLCACKKNKCIDGHTWELASTTATCFDGGVETYNCKLCKETKTENVEAYGHNLVQSSYTAPTCKTNGENVATCSRCGFESKQTILIIDHDYQVKTTTPSTCTVMGSQTLECSMCHETKTNTLSLLDHDYKLIDETSSTCTVKGSKTYKCKDCTDGYTTQLDLLSHSYQLVNTIQSTCSTKGSKDYECALCHDTYSDELQLKAHTYSDTLVEEPAATCFTTGEMAKKCEVCGNTEAQSETPLLSHNFGIDGYCTKCGIYKTLFDENAIASTYKGVVIKGSLVVKFKDGYGRIADAYWQDHIVTLTIKMLDKDGKLLETHSFNSTTIPHAGVNLGKLTIQYIDTNGTIGNAYPNGFIIFVDEGNIFSLENRQNCKSFTIEICSNGYEKIEKTYNIQ